MPKKLQVAVLVLCCVAPAFAAEPTTGPLAGTTAAHNQVRQNLNNGTPPIAGAAVQPVPFPPLPDFVWDDALAAGAQAWADGCSLNHAPPPSDFGENLILGGGVTGVQGAQGWTGEVTSPGYDYAAHTCGGGAVFPGCAHYTQVVWATSTKIGCGYANCGPGSEWVVCRYQTPGNIDVDNRRPYCTASQTTACELGPGGQRNLTVTKPGTGTGTVTSLPAGIDCGGSCSFDFDDGAMITLTAAATSGSAFGGWGGDCAFYGTNATCDLTMNAARSVTATFIDPCAAPLDLVCGVPENGTTSGASNSFQNYNASCSSFPPQAGPDVLYRLVPPEGGSVTVDLTNLAADYDLFVLGTCDPNNCAGGSENGGTAAEQVTFAATAGTPYRVIVEDNAMSPGTYTLSATCPCSAPDGVNHTATSSTVNGDETIHVCSVLTINGTTSVGAGGHWHLYGGHTVVFEDGLEVIGQMTVGHSP